ncbi:MAG: hypothetical protein JNL62_05780 [Bryobacterales bacterium]|nr:hypothetical protein [Bryobacterales bacterium]
MDLRQLLAKNTALQPAEAADCADQLVADILRRLRNGGRVPLPGVGVLQSDARLGIELKPLPRKNKGGR